MLLILIAIILLIALIVPVKREWPEREGKYSCKWRLPERKGKYSEGLVHYKLSGLPKEYIIYNDLLFESNGRSTQIDHVVVSPYGVFVIETKGYKGWIFGGENSEYWTQTLYNSNSKHRFYNPIRQNESHVRFLRYLLRCPIDIPFIPIIVFNNSADLKVHVENHIVVNRCDLLHAILQYKTPVIKQNTIDWIVKIIRLNHIVNDKYSQRRHNYNVQSRQIRSQTLVNQGICPRCGGKLVLRYGRYGAFYGCSNYPRCKFTLNV